MAAAAAAAAEIQRQPVSCFETPEIVEVLCADCPDQAMSAFAARQQLWGAAATRAASVLEKATPEAAPEIETRSRRTRSETPTVRSVAGRNSKRQPPLESLSADANQTQSSESEKGGPKYVSHVSITFPPYTGC